MAEDTVDHGEEERKILRDAFALVREEFPEAHAISVVTSDQTEGRGFWLTNVYRKTEPDGEALTPLRSVTQPGDDLLAELRRSFVDSVEDLLVELSWDGVVGEDVFGYALLEIPGKTEEEEV